MFHQIFAQHPAGIGEALRILLVLGIEKDSDRLHHRRREHNGLAARPVIKLVVGVDIGHPTSFAGVRIHQHGMHGGVGP